MTVRVHEPRCRPAQRECGHCIGSPAEGLRPALVAALLRGYDLHALAPRQLRFHERVIKSNRMRPKSGELGLGASAVVAAPDGLHVQRPVADAAHHHAVEVGALAEAVGRAIENAGRRADLS